MEISPGQAYEDLERSYGPRQAKILAAEHGIPVHVTAKLPPHFWRKRLEAGLITVQSEGNPETDVVTVRVRDGGENGIQIIEWYEETYDLLNDGEFAKPVGSPEFRRSVADYMDDLGIAPLPGTPGYRENRGLKGE